jgi:hypothetical protein
MEIKLTREEILSVFHTSLCNGLQVMPSYEITLDYFGAHYVLAKDKLKDGCFEDVLMQVLLDGNPLFFVDEEGGEENEVRIEDVLTGVPKVDPDTLFNIINERDDAFDADCVLQCVIFGEVIYG